MLSKNKAKELIKLHRSKFRKQEQRFIAEGPKVILDLLHEGVKPLELFASRLWLEQNEALLKGLEITEISRAELQKISALQTANEVLAVYAIPKMELNLDAVKNGWTICLDGVQDPGNLGTIIRLADWFGVAQIICSNVSVDVYNPKVVQSTMASVFRVKVHYLGLPEFLNSAGKDLPIYAAEMNGDSLHKTVFGAKGILVMGNEAKGVSAEIQDLITKSITISKFNKDSGIDSLNVATATAIILSAIRS
jgi:TrmH family RNA methyltransferase